MYRVNKRIFDSLFSLAVLLFGAPLFLFIGLAIKVSSNGPVFFKSSRLGRNYKPFLCFKFRTMYVDAEERLEELLQDPQKKREWERYRKFKIDPRVTPLGRFLRKTSLDELPQFINSLRGEISVVGPRPLSVRKSNEEVKEVLGDSSDEILSVKPGITGLWQTSGRSCVTIKRRRSLELCYVRRRSFLFDLALVAKTIPVMLSARGAY
ncbi:MAG: sugar transferase [Candidatus Algichlamydia australiensis]|nr:sugar transferase [Chlamydiales bacterium]